MINIKNLTEKDKGRYVEYSTEVDSEIGRIKGWNDKYIFVVFQRPGRDLNLYEQYTAVAVDPEDLEFIDYKISRRRGE